MRRPHLDRFDICLLGVLVALSLWTLGLDLWQVVVHGRIWTGTEAVYQEDGMQSLMWIEGILKHGASPDLYVLGHTPADFFQPLLAISAGRRGARGRALCGAAAVEAGGDRGDLLRGACLRPPDRRMASGRAARR